MKAAEVSSGPFAIAKEVMSGVLAQVATPPAPVARHRRVPRVGLRECHAGGGRGCVELVAGLAGR